MTISSNKQKKFNIFGENSVEKKNDRNKMIVIYSIKMVSIKID